VRGMAAETIARLSAPELASLLADLAEEKAALGAVESGLHDALDRRYGARLRQKQAELRRTTGIIRLEDNGFEVIIDLPKRVRWDQARLASIVEKIRASGEDPTDYVRIEYRVPERAYSAWPASIRSVFQPARTVESGKPTYRIEPKKETR
ncbi:MAG: hypothetical protein IRY94_20900, partial [Rhodospirillaceae bacterium]|nr:hypothetical protein [Rhodospirillaceae bacterium]